MKLWKLTFNQYTNGMRDTISCQGKLQPLYITAEGGVLYVALNDISELAWFDQYGKGIQKAEFLGGVFIMEAK